MEDRTINIIMITKRVYGMEDIKKAIAQYMSEECLCPKSVYTDFIIYSIVKEAFLDYLHSASHIRSVAIVRELLEAPYPDDLDRMLAVLGKVQVSEQISGHWQYIDGWHDTSFSTMLYDEICLKDFLKRAEEAHE